MNSTHQAYQRGKSNYNYPAYQHTVQRRSGARTARGRERQNDKADKFERKLLLQIIVSVIIFSVIWGINGLDGDLAVWVKNEVSYAVMHTVDPQWLYQATVGMVADITAAVVREERAVADDIDAFVDSTDNPTSTEDLAEVDMPLAEVEGAEEGEIGNDADNDSSIVVDAQ